MVVGKQDGDHILMTLVTDDFDRDYNQFKSRSVDFVSPPNDAKWGLSNISGTLRKSLQFGSTMKTSLNGKTLTNHTTITKQYFMRQ
jgi:hypothetical protein